MTATQPDTLLAARVAAQLIGPLPCRRCGRTYALEAFMNTPVDNGKQRIGCICSLGVPGATTFIEAAHDGNFRWDSIAAWNALQTEAAR